MATKNKMLRLDMERLVHAIQPHAMRGEDHADICHAIADKYELWNEEGRFPIWLSRVVEGVMHDVGENQMEV